MVGEKKVLKKVYGKISIFLILGLAFLLSGCSILPATEAPAKNNYLLLSPATQLPSRVHSNQVLYIGKVKSVSWLNTSKMAYQKNNDEIAYFELNQWAASLPELLQSVMLQSLQSQRGYRAVVSSPYSGQYDKRLDVNIVNFQQVFTQKPSVYLITLQMQLVDNHRGQIIRSKTITLSQKCVSDDPKGGVMAANQLLYSMALQWVKFVNENHPAQ